MWANGDDAPAKEFVDDLRRYLAESGKTARRVSQDAGLSPDTVSLILQGRRPRAQTVTRLRRILDYGVAAPALWRTAAPLRLGEGGFIP